MTGRQILLMGDNLELNNAVASLLKKISYDQIMLEREMPCADVYSMEYNSSNFTPDREYGWYHCFNKNNKKNKFKKI